MTQKNHRVSVIGAGAVGATLAQRILESGLADVVLLDILKNAAAGKSFDLLDASPIIGHERRITGTDDYRETESSDIVVITAGLPRKPGMSREDLISKNAAIVRDVSAHIKKYAPQSIVIVVTNPLDVMTYLAWRATGFDKRRLFGMAGVLDASRLAYLIADELSVERSSIETFVLGSHGDTMVPVLSKTRVGGRPVSELLTKEKIEKIVKRARDRGAEIVALLGSGSAYYSPSAAVFKMVKAVLNDTKEVLVASALLSGEYGVNDIYMGVPCRIGRGGIEGIVDLELSKEEEAEFLNSAGTIKSSIALLDSIK